MKSSDWDAIGNSGFGSTAAAETFAEIVRDVVGCRTVVEPLVIRGEATGWTLVRVPSSAMKRALDLRKAFDAGRRAA